MNRDFKGVWIPKEIWLNTELTLQEKVFLVEINSLDNEDGCFATNSYFADFFGISKTRVSLVIKSLIDKGYITSTIIYKEGTKEVLNRVLKVCYIPLFNKSYIPPLTKVKDPIQQKLKDNNTVNNTINNINNIYSDFEKIIKQKYVGKKTKAVRDKVVPKLLKKYSVEELTRVLERYASECKGKDSQYILNESTFWNGRYMDYLDENYEDNVNPKKTIHEDNGWLEDF